MAILVLGGAGYIGSHTVYELIDAGRGPGTTGGVLREGKGGIGLGSPI